jgi:uncharacterized protein (DUF1800 family)
MNTTPEQLATSHPIDNPSLSTLPDERRHTILPLGLLAFLASCGGGGQSPNAASEPAGTPTQQEAARFLLHAQFGASYSEITEVKRLGFEGWLNKQMALPSSLSGWDWLKSKGYDAVDQNEFFFNDQPTNYMVWYQIMASPDQVRRRMALALSEFFVVSNQGIQLNWPSFAMANYWDILCQHAFGNYRQLLEAVTLSNAMGSFLNTLGNQKEDPRSGRQPDENYAREVMQLFTVGLTQLNIDGSPKVGSNGQPLETYTQQDVSQLARVFTGYVLDEDGTKFKSPVPPFFDILPIGYTRRPMRLVEGLHSSGVKSFLGKEIPANTSGTASLQMALDTLFNHPNVGPFFSRQMIQRLVTSDPSPAYVARVAKIFNNNGKGVRGDLSAVFKAILLDPEALDAASLKSNTFGKLREPMVRIAQWAHTFKVKSTRNTWKMGAPTWSALESLAQSPLQAPSVFNFFRPGYVPPSTAMAATGATAPEFQLVNESTVSSYINYLQAILQRGIWVRAPELAGNPKDPTSTDGPDIVPDYGFEYGLTDNADTLVQHLNLLLCAGQLSAQTVGHITDALRNESVSVSAPENALRNHVSRALLFVMCSSDYLIQR